MPRLFFVFTNNDVQQAEEGCALGHFGLGEEGGEGYDGSCGEEIGKWMEIKSFANGRGGVYEKISWAEWIVRKTKKRKEKLKARSTVKRNVVVPPREEEREKKKIGVGLGYANASGGNVSM